MSAILVTGGTGTLGRALVPSLAAAGHQVTVLSRRAQPAAAAPADAGPAGAGPAAATPAAAAPVSWATGDLRSGAGIPAAVAGAEVIVHCATSMSGEAAAARNLTDAARQAGGPHLVYISIVGVDRVPFGYYRSKLAAEQLIAGSGLPWTMVRATQFHNLILAICAGAARLPVMPLPARFRFQPVEVTEVAARLADLAGGEPAGRAPDLGGPEIHPLAVLARSYLRASGRRRMLLAVPLPGAAAAAFRRGGNLAPEHATGRVTFEEFLARRLGGNSDPAPAGKQAGSTPEAQR